MIGQHYECFFLFLYVVWNGGGEWGGRGRVNKIPERNIYSKAKKTLTHTIAQKLYMLKELKEMKTKLFGASLEASPDLKETERQYYYVEVTHHHHHIFIIIMMCLFDGVYVE